MISDDFYRSRHELICALQYSLVHIIITLLNNVIGHPVWNDPVSGHFALTCCHWQYINYHLDIWMKFAARCETLRSHKPAKNTTCHGLSFSWVFFMQMKFKARLFPLHACQCVHGTWLCYRQSFNPIWHATYCDSGCPHPQVWFYSRKDNYFTFHLKFIIRGRERQVNDR